MPTESQYNKADKLIYHRYWGNMTGDEFLASLAEEKGFFGGISGSVGVIFDLSGLKTLPPAILTHARRAGFARYPSIVIALVGAKPSVQGIARIFAKLTHISVHSFDTFEQADAFVKAEIARIEAESI